MIDDRITPEYVKGIMNEETTRYLKVILFPFRLLFDGLARLPGTEHLCSIAGAWFLLTFRHLNTDREFDTRLDTLLVMWNGRVRGKRLGIRQRAYLAENILFDIPVPLCTRCWRVTGDHTVYVEHGANKDESIKYATAACVNVMAPVDINGVHIGCGKCIKKLEGEYTSMTVPLFNPNKVK